MLINKKSIVCILALLIASILPCSADDIQEVRSDSFPIQAGYGEVCDIIIEAIPAQSMAYIAGMPFDIEDAIVAYNSSVLEGGRTIAKFNILSNTPFKISFEGEPMRYMTSDGQTQYSRDYTDLHYYLYFDCSIGVYSNGVLVPMGQEIISFHSSDENPPSWSSEISMDTDSYVGNVEGNIRFMFDEDTTTFINTEATDANLPPGAYGADVRVYIEPLENQGGQQ